MLFVLVHIVDRLLDGKLNSEGFFHTFFQPFFTLCDMTTSFLRYCEWDPTVNSSNRGTTFKYKTLYSILFSVRKIDCKKS